RDARCREIFLIKATSLARRLLALPEDGRRVVIGISGGQDSTEALLVAAHAMDLLGLPRTRSFGVTMPGFGTSRETYENACALVRALGATLREIDITQIAGRVFEAIGHNPEREDHTFENVQAWTRTFLLLGPGGEIAQLSEELIGPYELHDFFLYYFLRFGFGPRRIARMAFDAFTGRYTVAEIRRWLLVFLERFFANQFKRDCVPDAPK